MESLLFLINSSSIEVVYNESDICLHLNVEHLWINSKENKLGDTEWTSIELMQWMLNQINLNDDCYYYYANKNMVLCGFKLHFIDKRWPCKLKRHKI